MFQLNLESLQPSQFWISETKLKTLTQQKRFDPIPVTNLDGIITMTDGHTRALIYHLQGHQKIDCVLEDEELNWDEYRFYVNECRTRNIYWIGDLVNRVIPHSTYQKVWIDYCHGVRSSKFSKFNG